LRLENRISGLFPDGTVIAMEGDVSLRKSDMKFPAVLALTIVLAEGAQSAPPLDSVSAYSPIQAGDHFVYRYEKSFYANISTLPRPLPSPTPWRGRLDIRYGGTERSGDSLIFTAEMIDARDAGFADTTRRVFLLRRDSLYVSWDVPDRSFSFLYYGSSSAVSNRGYPVLAYMRLPSGTHTQVGPDVVRTTYAMGGAEKDTTFFLKGIGPIYSKRGGGNALGGAEEKYQLVSHNGSAVKVPDYLKVSDPVSVRVGRTGARPNNTPMALMETGRDLAGRKTIGSLPE
jgi:hypothetical protein